MLKQTSLILTMIICSYTATWLCTSIQNSKNNRNDIYQLPPLVELDPIALKIIMFGKDYLYHDYLNIFLLQALTESPKNPDSAKMIKLISAVIKHHPKYETLYMLSCFVIMDYYNKPKFCVQILDEAIKVFPNSFRINITYGYVLAFVLDDKLKSSKYYFKASEAPNAPPHIKKVAEKLSKATPLDRNDLKQSIEVIFQEKFKNFLKENYKPPTN